ncbi:MAG: hypothetical protein OEN56_12400 [Gemmatimonadota bacterium]|nr:hypothetical protein [Gemmatimonadota bacterium]
MVGRRAQGCAHGERPCSARGGFVLALVVFMLFAISVAGMTGYLVVSSEFELSKHSGQGAEALAVARAGLERFTAEQYGVVDDTVAYALGNGVATVTTRKLFARDSITDMYYIRSEATVDDIFTPGAPARRVVGGYAIHHRRPLAHHAVVMVGADNVEVRGGGEAHGWDYKTVADCPGGGASQITGVITRLSVTESATDDIEGSPEYELWSGGWAEIVDSVGLRWDVLSDPNFAVDYENTLPSFASLPADSFPLIRYTGWVNANFTGRGVLIVDGVFDPGSSFVWDGIVLAKEVDDIIQGDLDGILIAGFEGPNTYSTVDFRTDVNYHSCYVYRANETLAYLELLPNTIFEVN